MDGKLKGYVVMKAVESIQGKRGKSSVSKVLKGSQGQGVLKTVEEFHLGDLWGIFYHIPLQEIEDTIAALLDKGFLYTSEAQFGGRAYPMLFISDQGRSVLAALEYSEKQKLSKLHKTLAGLDDSSGVSELGRQLHSFLESVTDFLNQWKDHRFKGMDFSEVSQVIEQSSAEYEELAAFIYHNTKPAMESKWRTEYVLDQTCRTLMQDLRAFLASLPEMEAQVFRFHYGVQDAFSQSKEDILYYYGIPEKEMGRILRKILCVFGSRSWYNRSEWVKRIANHVIGEDNLKENDFKVDIVKSTLDVTYELYQQGLQIEQIAAQRGLSISTIYSHFAKLISLYGIPIGDMISKERVELIQQALKEMDGEELKPIKEKLPDDCSYGEIKLVIEMNRRNPAA